MENNFKHIVPLGSSCGVAMMLERTGLRKNAYPFDWIISEWSGVEKSIKNDFKDWFNIELLYQSVDLANAYKNRGYNIKFFHDFNGYEPLDRQIEKVQSKYARRIFRFYKDISEPTFFIRKVLTEKSEEEICYLIENYYAIRAMLKSFNKDSEIYFIIDKNSLKQDVLDCELRKRIFLLNEKDSEDLSKAVQMDGEQTIIEFLCSLKIVKDQELGLRFFEEKQRKKKSFIKKIIKRLLGFVRKEYRHTRQYRKEEYIFNESKA